MILKSLYSMEANKGREFQDDDGTHPSQAACNALIRNYEMLHQLKYEHNPSALAERQRTLLQGVENSVQCLKLLVTAGYPLEAVDFSNSSLLHSLCWNPHDGQMDAVSFIVDFVRSSSLGGDGDDKLRALASQVNDEGESCLHIAEKTAPKSNIFLLPQVSGFVSPQQRNAEVIALLKPFALSKDSCELGQSPTVAYDASHPKQHKRSYLLRRGPHNRLSVEERHPLIFPTIF